ncbi:MAG: DUF89 family protein [Deltaproteobacteria bacterium]|nr:DUF89 family protein [Deltaproteobacteria bacterium]
MEAVRIVSDDRRLQLEVIREVTRRLMEYPINGPPDSDFITWFFRFISEATGREDPYSTIKAEFNQKAMGLYPLLKQIVSKSEDPLLSAAVVASAGNIMDEAGGLNFDLEESLQSAIRAGFKLAGFQGFKNSLSDSHRILYIADNAGEIVFDRLMLEEIGDHKVTYVVRGAPLGTDATIKDARFAGIDHVADVVSTEAEHPLRIVDSQVKELAKALDEADMIISKGMLNYELLTFQLQQPAFYILRIKCHNVRESLISRGNLGIGDVVLISQ